jgi:hypothetical protein
MVSSGSCDLPIMGSIPITHPNFTSWSRGEADGCNPSFAGSNPVDVSNFQGVSHW